MGKLTIGGTSTNFLAMPLRQTLGMKPVTRCGPRLRLHVLAKTRKDPVLPRMAETEPIILVDDFGALREARRILDRQRARPGRPPKYEAVSVVFGGPPPYCAEDPAWPEERGIDCLMKQYEWWLTLLGPESLLIAAAIHRDEAGPHGHLVFAPVLNGRISWSQVQLILGEGVPGDVPYTRIHTRFHRDVSSHFGLERGVEGSGAAHEEPDPVIAEAMKQVRLRQIHERREQARAAGEPPCRIPELMHREHWELQLMAGMTYPEEAGRVEEWRRIAKLPCDKHLAHRGRLETQLAIAQDQFDAAWEYQIDYPDDPVASKAEMAWRMREKELRKALDSDRFDDVDESIGNDPVPGYSEADWARFISASQEEERRHWIDAEEEYPAAGAEAELDRYARPTQRDDLQRKPN